MLPSLPRVPEARFPYFVGTMEHADCLRPSRWVRFSLPFAYLGAPGCSLRDDIQATCHVRGFGEDVPFPTHLFSEKTLGSQTFPGNPSTYDLTQRPRWRHLQLALALEVRSFPRRRPRKPTMSRTFRGSVQTFGSRYLLLHLHISDPVQGSLPTDSAKSYRAGFAPAGFLLKVYRLWFTSGPPQLS